MYSTVFTVLYSVEGFSLTPESLNGTDATGIEIKNEPLKTRSKCTSGVCYDTPSIKEQGTLHWGTRLLILKVFFCESLFNLLYFG